MARGVGWRQLPAVPRKMASLLLGLILLLCGFDSVEGGAGRNIEETASYRVAMFFVFFLVLSLLLEQFFHHLEHCLHHTGQVGLGEAVHKIKEELMLMGFISLMLIALEEKIVRLCVEPSVDPESIYCCSVQAPNLTDFQLREAACCGISEDGYYSNYSSDGSTGRRQLATAACEITDEYVACMNATVTDWAVQGGYVPGSDSNLLDVCRAPGQTTGHLPSGAHAFECTDTWIDEDGVAHQYASFMDALALHNLHTLIFLTALFHIVYSAIIMLLSQCCVTRWAQWEQYGDDDGESIKRLVAPANWENRCSQCVVNFFEQFYKNVDPLAYMVIRRYYILRNSLPSTFDFNVQLREAHRKDFKDLVGVSWWMWFVVIGQTLLDGYITSNDRWLKMINTYLAFIVCVAVGTKLMFIYRDLVTQTLEATKGMGASKDFQAHHISLDQLAELQSDEVSDYTRYDHIEAQFWCRSRMKEKSPKIILNMIRLVMFQNSLVLAQFLFYVWQIGTNACYFQGRTNGGEDYTVLIIQLVVLLSMMFINGFVTVPLYSLCAITLHHDHEDTSHTEDYAAIKKVRLEDQRLLEENKKAEAVTLSRILGQVDEMEQTDLDSLATKIQQEIQVRKAANTDKKPEETKAAECEQGSGCPPASESMAVNSALKAFRGQSISGDSINFRSLGRNAFIMQAKTQILELKISTMKKQLGVFKRAQAKADAEERLAKSRSERADGLSRTPSVVITNMSRSRSPSPPPKSKDKAPPTTPGLGWGQEVSKEQQEPTLPNKSAKVHPAIEKIESHQDYVVKSLSPDEETISELAAHHPGMIVATLVFLILIAVILMLISSLDAWYPHFGYYVPHWAYDGYGAPEYWSDLTQDSNEMKMYNDKNGATDYSKCASGTAQSPIDIHVGSGAGVGYSTSANNFSLGDLLYLPVANFVQYQSHDVPVYTCQTGHYGCGAVVWNDHQYNLYKFKFHAPAEHRLDGLQTNAELQIYFCDGDCDKKYDNWVAIAVLLVVEQEVANVTQASSIEEFYKILGDPAYDQDVLASYADMEALNYPTNLSNIVSKSSGFYQYDGSMTIPPCYENIKWFVMAELATIGHDQWKNLADHIGYPGNSRPPPASTVNTVPTYYAPDPSHVSGINEITSAQDMIKPTQSFTGQGPSTSSGYR